MTLNVLEVLKTARSNASISIRTVGLRASDYNRRSMTEWTAHCAPNGQPYFYNATTGESSWAPPVVQTQKLKRSSSFDRDNFSNQRLG